jgi:isocitrate dehydrogenase
VLHPERLNVVVFRENTEDVYAGLEWESGSQEARELVSFLSAKLGAKVREGSAVGLKPVSENASKRLVRKAIQYAIDHRRKSVTLIHKGNIMKFTEGAFRDWGYEVAAEEFSDSTVAERELSSAQGSGAAAGKIVIKDRIADSMFQQVLLRPEEYDVLATTNLNGDYISDACAAQIGGLGLAPGANIGDGMAVFEATHGTGQSESQLTDTFRCTDVRLHGVEGGGSGHRGRFVQYDCRQDRDLRSSQADERGYPA